MASDKRKETNDKSIRQLGSGAQPTPRLPSIQTVQHDDLLPNANATSQLSHSRTINGLTNNNTLATRGDESAKELKDNGRGFVDSLPVTDQLQSSASFSFGLYRGSQALVSPLRHPDQPIMSNYVQPSQLFDDATLFPTTSDTDDEPDPLQVSPFKAESRIAFGMKAPSRSASSALVNLNAADTPSEASSSNAHQAIGTDNRTTSPQLGCLQSPAFELFGEIVQQDVDPESHSISSSDGARVCVSQRETLIADVKSVSTSQDVRRKGLPLLRPGLLLLPSQPSGCTAQERLISFAISQRPVIASIEWDPSQGPSSSVEGPSEGASQQQTQLQDQPRA
eukprot:TRINITY_DN7969_c0_g3_i1.p1 TRINITY_DN7969_c0_g3~~TRINITY_DN7969_c0_g3_i1.p1  ORF type:complete len:337 (+),score=46.68 TRINITY_DN7969_c0_g3_i1:309-1319(+)